MLLHFRKGIYDTSPGCNYGATGTKVGGFSNWMGVGRFPTASQATPKKIEIICTKTGWNDFCHNKNTWKTPAPFWSKTLENGRSTVNFQQLKIPKKTATMVLFDMFSRWKNVSPSVNIPVSRVAFFRATSATTRRSTWEVGPGRVFPLKYWWFNRDPYNVFLGILTN